MVEGCADVCCEHDLDADRACCAAGVDECGVCGGDGGGCFGRAALPLVVAAPGNTTCTAAAVADAGSWCWRARADFCDALQRSLALAPAAARAAAAGALACEVGEMGAAAAARRRLSQAGAPGEMALEVLLQGPRGLFSESTLVLLAAADVPGALIHPLMRSRTSRLHVATVCKQGDQDVALHRPRWHSDWSGACRWVCRRAWHARATRGGRKL